MGEIADMIIAGDMCQECGTYLGEGDGFPRSCGACQKVAYSERTQSCSTKTSCPTCGKRVKKAGLADHQRDVHGAT